MDIRQLHVIDVDAHITESHPVVGRVLLGQRATTVIDLMNHH